MIRSFVLTLLLLVAALPACAQTPNGETRHYVFAHYMVCFQSSKEFYKREIELAQRHGIDGFALNSGDWARDDGAPGTPSSNNYTSAADRMYQAAEELGTGFKLFNSADVTGINDLPLQMGDMVKRYYKSPAQFRLNGKAVISCWAGSAAFFAPAIKKMKQDGYDVVFIPCLDTPRYTTSWSPETVHMTLDGQDHVDGLFNFAADNTTEETVRNNSVGRRVAGKLGKYFMAGLSPAYNSPNLRDFRGMQGIGRAWQGLIGDDADLVELVTWNDYTEDSNLMPFRWSTDQNKPYFDRDESFLDVTSYYSAWYKTGAPPAITQDKLYYVTRNRSKHITQAWDATQGKWIDITAVQFPYDQIHDDVQDNVYVTTFLTAPAELNVTIGTQSHDYSLPAGVDTVAVPMAPGVPRFLLARNKQTLIDVLCRKQIIGVPTKENSPFGLHLSNRTWTGAAVAGKGIRLEATAGKLGPGTTTQKIGGATLVQTSETAGSGFTVPLSGLTTGTYCVRIFYSNPAADETRLTVNADGPSAGPNDPAYMIPAFLPPTGAGQIAATSFIWSLYDKSSFLSITWQPGPTNLPSESDRGTAMIQAIELVKIDPVKPTVTPSTVWPELTTIPGGTFTMGDAKGQPSEAPTHTVTLSDFWMSKTEVTNAQFEQFDPTHKAYRTSYSWRDRDPVIYVSWTDGARYANWLSKQAGLSPAYDEKTWMLDTTANGFRMPTEAQWEYCASGRGEDRTYPWGNEPLDATRGNFGAALTLASSGSATLGSDAVTPVGSFPLGASRDGVLDMAGNVSEWCTDTLQPYTPDAQKDPCVQTPGNFRVIRGGSFGYYGISQRVRMREFNNQNYPGYVYIGLRIALPASGARKLGIQ